MKSAASCRDGIVAGLYGGGALIGLFFAFDLVRLDPLATPILLSGAMLGDAPETSPGVVAALRIGEWVLLARNLALFTALHLAVFAGLGVAAAVLFGPLGLPKHVLTGALYGAVVCSLVFYTSVTAVAGANATTAIDWRLLLGANALAGVIMVAQLAGEEHDAADGRRGGAPAGSTRRPDIDTFS
ncbi:MAG: hypothetical protein ACRELC_02830 [Gemmatimonadota bacterium]